MISSRATYLVNTEDTLHTDESSYQISKLKQALFLDFRENDTSEKTTDVRYTVVSP
jgi:hypothetical protein